MTPLPILHLRRGIGCALLLLTGATWKLWLPVTEFPRIPFWGAMCSWPLTVDWQLCGGLACSAVAMVAPASSTKWTRWAALVLAAFLTLLILLDQHRLQPWAYEVVLLAVTIGLAPNDRGMHLMRLLIASIYLWSGLSKLDNDFFEDHGRMLLDGLLKSIGASTALWSAEKRWAAVAAMPLCEIGVGILLAWPRLRKVGIGGSVALHLAIIAAVGPLGLGHEPAVLIWNLFFIVQNVIVYRRRAGEVTTPESLLQWRRCPWNCLAAGVTTAAILLPALNIIGWFDHWPSWSVYSSRPSFVTVYVDQDVVGRLPASLRPLVDPPDALERWQRVRLDQWSFEQLRCPPSPQERWKLALALAVAERAGIEDELRVFIAWRTSWMQPGRELEEIIGRGALRRACDGFLLNTRSTTSPTRSSPPAASSLATA